MPLAAEPEPLAVPEIVWQADGPPPAWPVRPETDRLEEIDPEIDLEDVRSDPDPPNKAEPPPVRGGPSESPAGPSLRSIQGRVDVFEWGRTMREAENLIVFDRAVAFILGTYMNFDGGNAWPSVSTLAKKCGLSDSTVRRSLRHLEAGGWLFTEQRPGRTSVYAATVPGGAEIIRFPTPITTDTPQSPLTAPPQSGLTDDLPLLPTQEEARAALPSSIPEAKEWDPTMWNRALSIARRKHARTPDSLAFTILTEDLIPSSRGEQPRIDHSREHRLPEQHGHGDTGDIGRW